MSYVALDVHRRRTQVAAVDDAGRELFNRNVPNDGAVDRIRGLIARCADAIDVLAAVGRARDHDVEVAVRGGGHGVTGNALSDGGIVTAIHARRPALRQYSGVLVVGLAGQAHGLAVLGMSHPRRAEHFALTDIGASLFAVDATLCRYRAGTRPHTV